jgi:hypothetical protein
MALILRRPKAVSKDGGQFICGEVFGASSFETRSCGSLLRTRK